MAVTGFVLALVTILIAWIPFVGLAGLVTWPLGLIFSIIGLTQVNKSQGRLGGKGLALAGLIISLVGVIVIIVTVVGAVVFVLVSDLGDDTSFVVFPNVLVDGDGNGGITIDHVGGDCIDTADYEFRVDGSRMQPTPSGTFCVGDEMTIREAGPPGSTVTLVIIDVDAQAQVYKKTVQV